MLILCGQSNCFFFIPILVWIVSMLANKVFKYNLSEKLNIVTTIITFFILCAVENSSFINQFYLGNRFTVLTLLSGIFFMSLLTMKCYNIKSSNLESEKNPSNQHLFNLFYINTSKVHEIVMLIDNKIMKTVEREQVSEELLRTTSSLTAQTGKLSGETSVQKEDNSKKRVYENFDVKTTKSIMLRKLYEVAKNNNSSSKKFSAGQLILFKDIELKRRNIDDTVMILNVLQDSKLKNQGNDSIEINMNKMMEKMLDDFTIDYQFEQDILGDVENAKCLIQLPYKSNDNFENGYQHNDLQLGKLSIVGIYRGEIDFSQRESVSSKFLDMLSESYKNEVSNQNDDVMKTSSTKRKQQAIPFDFKPNKLNEKMHLIDVIAIIQELNINREGESDE